MSGVHTFRGTPALPALLVLEDGTMFRGRSFGAGGTVTGEVVFNTGMTGYQEVLTDPSYHRQIVAMTAPHQGNYGVTAADAEASRVQVAGFVVRESSRGYSNWRATGSLDDELARNGTVGIAEVDTRRLTRHIREAGAMRAAISSEILDADALLEHVRAAPHMVGSELASEVSTPTSYRVDPALFGVDVPTRFRVVVYDFGLKRNQLKMLATAGCDVTVVPATTPADDVLALDPDGVFLSNGPGDPATVRSGITAIQRMLAESMPTFGICLGNQLLGHAVGARTYKLRFGHRGINQPVRNIDADRIEITSHNHGFAVDADSLPADGPFGRVIQSHVNLNDGVNEGLRCLDVPAFSVQYHPEAAPGPHDAGYLFDEFTALMARVRPSAAERL